MGSLSSSPSDLASLRALTGRERIVLAAAAVVAPVAHLLLRTAGYGRTRLLGERLSPAPHPVREGRDRAVRTARLVWVADRRVPGSRTCLSRSLALWYLLRWQRVDSDLRIGVRAGAGPLDAHAWVEHQGHPLNDDEGVAARYATLERGTPPSR